VFVALWSVLLAQSAMAQSTIFNIPSTDTVDMGKAYFEIDFLPQAPGPDVGAILTIYNPRLVVGLPHNAEVGVNFPIYHSSDYVDPSSFVYIQPNIKWKFFKNDAMGLAATAGAVVNVPLNSRDGQLSWAYIYGNISKKIMAAKGARVTAGPYGVIAKQDDPVKVGFLGTRGGILLGYEQPLGGPVSFVADWFSGKNSIGYFTPGISVTLPHSGLLNIGYSFGNDSISDSTIKNRFLFVYYGVTF
jgi:hypothetical protein